jgi:hypothetical protein
VKRWERAERLLAKQKKEKAENGGQVGGGVAVSGRWVGGKPLDFLGEMA